MAAAEQQQQRRPTARQRRLSHAARALPTLSLARQPNVILGQIAAFLPLTEANALFTASQATAATSRDEANVWRALALRDFPPTDTLLLANERRNWKHIYKQGHLIKRAARRLTEQTLWVFAANDHPVTFKFLVGETPIPGAEMNGAYHDLLLWVRNPHETFPQTASLQPGLFEHGPYVRRVTTDVREFQLQNSPFLWSLLTTFYEEMILHHVPGQNPQALTVTAVATLRKEPSLDGDEGDEDEKKALRDVPVTIHKLLQYTKFMLGADIPGLAKQWQPWTDVLLSARSSLAELNANWRVYPKRDSAALPPFTVSTNDPNVLAHIHDGAMNEAELPSLLQLFSRSRHEPVDTSYSFVYSLTT